MFLPAPTPGLWKGGQSGGWGRGEPLVLIPASCRDCPRLLHGAYLRMSQLWKRISPLTCFYAIDTSLTSCRKNARFGNRRQWCRLWCAHF